MARWTIGLIAAVVLIVGCGGNDSDGDVAGASFVRNIGPAIEAVEAELGAPQQYFEVTANSRVTNVFVATDDATAVVHYMYVDGNLQPPSPKQTGASGYTFAGAAVDFDADVILDGVGTEVPEATVESLSVEGGQDGAVRYVISTVSTKGGVLDVTVAADGRVLEVAPV